MTRTTTVNNSGRRFRRFSVHRVRNSSLWFFFTTMLRRNGEMNSTVNMPQMALAYQWSSHPGSIRRSTGSTKVNIRAMTADERMP